MVRPNKNKYICKMPRCKAFSPFCNHSNIEITLSIEEFETIRLIDYDNKTQLQAAEQMGTSRSTIQALYSSARKKISRFLIESTTLRIEGGTYELNNTITNKKGDNNMKIAVTYENGLVFQHFGHTEQFKVYNVEDNKIISSEIINTNGQGHGALATFLSINDVSVLICGGIGGGARNALAEAGIEIFPGASGDADKQVESFLEGKLEYNPNTMCNHHAHEEGHTCGSNGCGNHGCH